MFSYLWANIANINDGTPGVGFEPTSPEGHQLTHQLWISRLTPVRALDLPSLGTPALFLIGYCNLMFFRNKEFHRCLIILRFRRHRMSVIIYPFSKYVFIPIVHSNWIRLYK
jgi:hypothetical protein